MRTNIIDLWFTHVMPTAGVYLASYDCSQSKLNNAEIFVLTEERERKQSGQKDQVIWGYMVK